MEARRGILFLFFLAVGTFVFSADFSRAAGPTVVPQYIEKPTTWTKENSPYIVQSKVYVQAKLTIEPGTVVKFSQPSYSMHINAEFSARGTKNEKVVFTSIHDDSDGENSDIGAGERDPRTPDWEGIKINPAAKVDFVNAVVKYARVAMHSIGSSANYENLTIRNSEVSHAVTGIYMENLEPVIESNLITKNGVGIIAFINSGFDRLTKVSNNSFVKNGSGIHGSNSVDQSKPSVDARNNWWGDSSGPKVPGTIFPGKGDAVDSFVLFDPWLGKDTNDGPDPVIVIPGIMGSWEVDGKWKIDPIFHTYDNLRDEFLANGYENGKTFFTFPYEWRDSNVDNAKLLAKKIEDIRTETGRPKVDIVAHSMGGLLAREYIESNYFANDVDQLITVGTPHLGAPKDYIKWEAGEFFDDLIERAGRSIFYLEALENGYTGIFPYIRAKIPSVQELLPVYNYLHDENGGSYTLRDSYWENYPRNEFLEKLNEPEKVERLKNVEFIKAVGRKNDSASTISGYNVVDFDIIGIWDNGYPKYFDIPLLNNQGFATSDGDKTVPLYSAEAANIPADKMMHFPSEHGALPTDAQKNILEILTGIKPASEITKWHVPNILLLLVHSPVDIQVESPSGEKIGKDFDTNGTFDQIEGAYYTGFETKSEFITIPNPEDGEYKITTQGTGEGGPYTIETVKIMENPADPDNAKESSVLIEGVAQPNEKQEAEVELTGDEVIYNPDKTPPVISISSPEEKSYNNDEILTIDYSAEDDESGIESDEWQVEKDRQKLDWTEKSVDLSLEHLGEYIFTVSAEDKAGNSGVDEVRFQITTSLDAIQKNLGHYFDLGLIKKKAAFRYFNTKLKNLGKLFEFLEKMENSESKPKLKEASVKVLKKLIEADINRIIRQIDRKSPQWINQKAADFLIEDLNAIRIK